MQHLFKRLLLALSLSLPIISSADFKEFKLEYSYTAGSADNEQSARRAAFQAARLQLLDNVGNFVHGELIDNSDKSDISLKLDTIQALAAGLVKINVLDEYFENQQYLIEARVDIDTEELIADVAQLAIVNDDNYQERQLLIEARKYVLQLLEDVKNFNSDAAQYAKVQTALEAHEIYQKAHYFLSRSRSNDEKALALYRQAVKLGSALATYDLAYMYMKAYVVEEDYQYALKLYKQVAATGLAVAETRVARMYSQGWGAKKSDKQALAWFIKAATRGDSFAQTSIGALYERGTGVKANFKTAVDWYRKAAEQGDVSGQVNLGHMYEQGQGVKKNYQEAAKWYRKAADKGDIYGQMNLAHLYENGSGVKKNIGEAIKLYEKAAEQGDYSAAERLDVLRK
ncbi:MAG: tetratricopeptide repeat protein [Kangiellaceae bacterium]|nr:tetratricopeptide repeat protein [Kangiellaceae bacterium]